jgi:hypothetical protein
LQVGDFLIPIYLSTETRNHPIEKPIKIHLVMKRRVRKIANFLAFNLLFFALYLNFIHKDNQSTSDTDTTVQSTAAAFSGTVLVEHPEKYLVQKQ